MPTIHVLRSFTLLAGGRELRFRPGEHEVSPEVAWHPFIARDFADGCVESPPQAEARLAREAAEAERRAAEAARQSEADRAAAAKVNARTSKSETASAAPKATVETAADAVKVARVESTTAFDWAHPDYGPINAGRLVRLALWRKDPALLASSKEHYREHLEDWVNDLGTTADQRNALIGRLVIMPFMCFPRQREWLQWVQARAKPASQA